MTYTLSQADYLAHYGTPRHSGRYPWGSGEEEDGPQRNRSFLDTVASLRSKGMSEAEVARALDMTTTELRAQKSIEKNRIKQDQIGMAQRLKAKGMSNTAIGERMKLNESSVRALLAPGEKDKLDILHTTSKMLEDQVNEKQYLDIGAGVEMHLGVSKEKLATAVSMLQKEKGYEVRYVKIEQLGTGQQTTLKVLTKPGVPYSELYKNRDQIKQIADYSDDGGRSFDRIHPPLSINSKRVGVRYAEQGGADADGVIYVRPGVNDISLGKSRYAQVRIGVDGTHYLKGMAMYKDDLPDGVDLMFNTNKSDTGNKKDAMKKMIDDPNNPFGSMIKRQMTKDGKVTSVMNVVNEEGDWGSWSKTLSSQMLSKQTPSLIKNQLKLAELSKKEELEDILSLSNPAVKRKLLESYSDDADSSAVHLKAAALPRQANHVILPLNSMRETEIYAPNYRNGEKVVLIRHPHGGKFEIPELTVNNNHPEARKLLGNAIDAVGINAKVAERLSGADFDGDTVLVIPNNKGSVKTAPALEKLKAFDPKAMYPAYEGMPRMKPETKGLEMGVVSNLITDMSIRGASADELSRAVRHSMVVIDAEKHHLDYKKSAIDHGIPQLKAKYQNDGNTKGASTLISRAKSEERVLDRKPRSAAKGGPIDRNTGKKVYEQTGDSYEKDGKIVIRKTKSTKLAEADDAHSLSSGTTVEKIYADHSNALKALGNRARKEMVNTRSLPYSPSAKKVYRKEVETLNSKLNVALRNRPFERQAQIVANGTLSAKRRANPSMDKAELKKTKALALQDARARVGAKKIQVDISDDEWKAIQAGAITNNKLMQILNNSDLTRVKTLATPKTTILMTSTKKAKADALIRAGYTQSEVADALGVSLTTLKKSIGGEG